MLFCICICICMHIWLLYWCELVSNSFLYYFNHFSQVCICKTSWQEEEHTNTCVKPSNTHVQLTRFAFLLVKATQRGFAVSFAVVFQVLLIAKCIVLFSQETRLVLSSQIKDQDEFTFIHSNVPFFRGVC